MIETLTIGGIAAGTVVAAYAAYKRTGNTSATVEADVTEGTVEADIESDANDDIEYQMDEDVEKTPEPIQNIGNDLASIKGIGPKRAEVLMDNEFINAADLYYADDSEIAEVKGFGEYAVEQIREDIGSVDEDTEEGNSDEQNSEDEQQSSTSEESDSNEAEDSEESTSESDESEEDGNGTDSGNGSEEDADEEDAPSPEADGADEAAA